MASGDTLLSFSPLSNSPPDVSYASLDLRSGFAVLDFDDSSNEQALFHALLPSHYGGGPLRANINWTSSIATSGSIRLRVEITRIQSGDNLDSLPPTVSNTEFNATAPGTNGDVVMTQSSSLSTGGATAGEILLVSITRLANNVSDTLIGDIELLSLELIEV